MEDLDDLLPDAPCGDDSPEGIFEILRGVGELLHSIQEGLEAISEIARAFGLIP